MKRGTGPLLLMLGLLMGPVYYIVATYLSGAPGESYVMTERAARWTLPDGTIMRFARTLAYRPVDVPLDPKMNRIGLELAFEFAPAANSSSESASDEYQATLSQGDQPILRRVLTLNARSGSSRKVDAGSLEVYYPGTYTFILEGPAEPRVAVTSVKLQVITKVETASLTVTTIGAVLLVVGLALSLEPYLPRRFLR